MQWDCIKSESRGKVFLLALKPFRLSNIELYTHKLFICQTLLWFLETHSQFAGWTLAQSQICPADLDHWDHSYSSSWPGTSLLTAQGLPVIRQFSLPCIQQNGFGSLAIPLLLIWGSQKVSHCFPENGSLCVALFEVKCSWPWNSHARNHSNTLIPEFVNHVSDICITDHQSLASDFLSKRSAAWECIQFGHIIECKTRKSLKRDDSPSVVPAAKLKPMAAGQVLPARVKLLASTTTLVMSINLCR